MSSNDSDVPPLAIGSDVWPGLAKLAEECGELLQVIGKLAAYPSGPHPDGTDLLDRLHDELGDVAGAIHFVIATNDVAIDAERVGVRQDNKCARFERWHRQAIADALPGTDRSA